MRYLEQKMQVRKNSRSSIYAKIFSALFFTLFACLKSFSADNGGIVFMQYLERFYAVSKNSCTQMYTKIFFATRNHSICQPKNNSAWFEENQN